MQEERKKVKEAVENMGLEERRDISHYKVNIYNMNTHLLKAFLLLDNDGWVSRVNITFDPTSKRNVNDISQVLCKYADTIQQTLLAQMSRHIRRRIANEKKRKHWCMEWAASNMAQMDTLMVLFNHMKNESVY